MSSIDRNRVGNGQRPASSRGWIVEAFNQLVLRRGYDRFGVRDLVSRAGVGRSTFYDYFRNKDDVLRDAVGHMLETFAAIISHPEVEAPTRSVVEHISTHRPVARQILAGSAGEAIVQQLTELIALRLAHRGGRDEVTTGSLRIPTPVIAEQIARSQIGLLRAWVTPEAEPCTPAALAGGLHVTTKALVDAMMA